MHLFSVRVSVAMLTMAMGKQFFVFAAVFHFAWCLTEITDAERHDNLKIIGGHQISIEKAPFMVSLRLNSTYHWCGGSIIHEQFVLTAAHCIVPNRGYNVLVGTDNISGPGDLYEIEEIHIHQRYSNTTFDFDICVIKLKKPIIYGPKVKKIDLANIEVKLPKGIMLNVTGWGATESKIVSPHLLQVTIPKIQQRKCQESYFKHRHVITKRMVCAGRKGHDSCQGDSGGPLTLGNIQVGVTSFGYGCGVDPGVYTKVSTVLPWIMNIMNLYQN